ncbi:MAG: asparagine synthase (glutamine-hydrolyzing) [Phycisphaerae bacterium]
MCGIAGVVSERGITDEQRLTVAAMLDDLSHRGPDGRGTWSDENAALGHTRLAIIDPHGGKQPIANEDGTVHIVANGEIYNHQELRRELEARGHRFRTRSDTEPIVHLYEEVGPACVERLRGMFAIAIWDAPRRRLLLARDPVGVKPLYHARIGGTIIFASQLNALLRFQQLQRTVDLQSLHNYLTYHYVPSPRTILEGVSKLGPGQRLLARAGAHSIENYWDVDFQADDRPTDAEWLSRLEDGLLNAVRAQLLSDVPVGAFLSGGLDSSIVVAAMARASSPPVSTFTAGFDDPRFDERRPARSFAQRLRTDHHEQIIRPDPCEIVVKLAACFDEPFADPSAVPTFYISRLASRHVKTVLSGDGGDEILAGYTRYRRHHQERALRYVASNPVARTVIDTCAAAVGGRAASAARNLAAPPDRAHYLSVAWFDPVQTRTLLSGDVARQLQDHDPFDVLASHFARCKSTDPLARSQYVDFKSWLADGVLCKVDRAAMASSLEVRVPLLDLPWVELAATLPKRMKIRHGRGKFALRRIIQSQFGRQSKFCGVARDIALRPKRGFEVPLDDWFKGPLKTLARDMLLSRDTRISQWLDPAAVKDTWRQLQQGRRGIGPRLWALLMLETWARRFLTPWTPTAPSHKPPDPILTHLNKPTVGALP